MVCHNVHIVKRCSSNGVASDCIVVPTFVVHHLLFLKFLLILYLLIGTGRILWIWSLDHYIRSSMIEPWCLQLKLTMQVFVVIEGCVTIYSIIVSCAPSI